VTAIYSKPVAMSFMIILKTGNKELDHSLHAPSVELVVHPRPASNYSVVENWPALNFSNHLENDGGTS
jgi:hypothetical protein